jgi:hypothetical protein
MTAYIYEAEAAFRRASDVKLDLPKDIQALMILDGAKLGQHHQQLVAKGCNFECKDPNTDAPRIYGEIVAGTGRQWERQQLVCEGCRGEP